VVRSGQLAADNKHLIAHTALLIEYTSAWPLQDRHLAPLKTRPHVLLNRVVLQRARHRISGIEVAHIAVHTANGHNKLAARSQREELAFLGHRRYLCPRTDARVEAVTFVASFSALL